MPLLRYAYYAFVFSLPFEAADIGVGTGIGTLSRLLGFTFVMVALLQPSFCFRLPPKPYWYFVAYSYVLVVLIFWFGVESQQAAIRPLFTLVQLLALCWISCNLMRHEEVRTRTLEVLALSCTLLALMLVFHIVTLSSADPSSMVGTVSQQRGRVTAFGANPNAIGVTLTLGLLALVGLVFGQERASMKARLLAWPCLGIFAVALVRTGSRGAVVALMAGLLVLLLKGKGINPKLISRLKKARLKIALVVVVLVGLVAVFSFQYEPIRVRWERTLTEGDTAGRDRINAESLNMFLERPLLGWGPGTFYYELGSRMALPIRHPHNLYFWLVLETGLIGAVPFVVGLWLCWRGTWRARGGIHSVVAPALLVTLLTLSLKTANHKNKLFWVVLAYALASGSLAALPAVRRAASASRQTAARMVRRKARPRSVAAVERPSGRPPPS